MRRIYSILVIVSMFSPMAVHAANPVQCVKEGQSLGQVYPGNTSQCCSGLAQRLPSGNDMGRGTCEKPVESVRCVKEGGALGAVVPGNAKICCEGLTKVAPATDVVGAVGWCGVAKHEERTVKSPYLNLRKSPGFGRNVISVLRRGHQVSVTEKLGPWCRVSTTIKKVETIGFVACELLK